MRKRELLAQEVLPAFRSRMSTAAHLIAFGVGHKDATRIAHDLVIPRLETFEKEPEHSDLYGGYGKQSYWSVGDQVNNIVHQLMHQNQRELIWRMRMRHSVDIYIARTAHIDQCYVTEDEENAYREQSARIHAYIPSDES